MGGGDGATVSDFFIQRIQIKKKKGGDGATVSDFFIQRIQIKKKTKKTFYFLFGGGGGGGGGGLEQGIFLLRIQI